MTLEQKIQTALDRNIIKGAKSNTKLLLAQEHKAEWTKAKQAEYDILYPLFQYAEAYELNVIDEYGTLEDDWVVYDSTIDEHGVSLYCLQKKIDYLEDENYVTFNDWLNETRVVTEAVEEVSHIEEIDGIETKVIDTPYQPEVKELVRPYIPLEITDEMVNAKLEQLGYNYASKRKAEYPPIEEQLDMQYKDSLDGGTRFKDAIAAVKAKYPKA